MSLFLLDYVVRSHAYIYDDSDNSLERIDWEMFESCISQGLEIDGMLPIGGARVNLCRTAPIQDTAVSAKSSRVTFAITGVYIYTTNKGIRYKIVGNAIFNKIADTDSEAASVWQNFINQGNVIIKCKEEKSVILRKLMTASGGSGKVEIWLHDIQDLHSTEYITFCTCRDTVVIGSKTSLDGGGDQIWKTNLSVGNKFCRLQIPNVYGVDFDQRLSPSSDWRLADLWKFLYTLGYRK